MENSIKQKYLIGVLILVFTASFCANTQGVFLTDFINNYGLESSSQGLVSSFQSAGNLIALLLIGVYLSRIKKSTLLMVFAVIVPILFFCLGLKPPFVVLLLLYGFYGLCFALVDSVSSSTMADLYPEKSANKMNLLQAAFGLGGLCGPFILQIILNTEIVWNEVLFIVGGFALVVTIIFVLTARPMMKSKEIKYGTKEAIKLVDIKDYFVEKKKLFLIVSLFLFGMLQIGMIIWMPRFIGEYLGAPKYGAISLSLYWFGITVSRLLLAKIRFDQVRVLSVGLILSGVLLTFGILIGNSTVMILLCAVMGFCQGPVLPNALSLSCSWTNNTSLGSSIILFCLYTGNMLSAPLIGFIIKHLGASLGLLFPAMAGVIGGVFAAVIIPIINSESPQNLIK